MSENKTVNYVEPSEFFHEVLVSLKNDEISDRLSVIFMTFASKFVNHKRFVRYRHLREDLIAVAITACVKSWSKFRPIRNNLVRDEEGNIISSTKVDWDGITIIEYDYRTCYNPFSFFTTCASNELLQFLKDEYYQRNVMNKLLLANGFDADDGYISYVKAQEDAAKLEADAANEEMKLIDECAEDDEQINKPQAIIW